MAVGAGFVPQQPGPRRKPGRCREPDKETRSFREGSISPGRSVHGPEETDYGKLAVHLSQNSPILSSVLV